MTKKYLKNIIFTKSQLTGSYRYKNEFQFYPLDLKNAPTFDKIDNIPICFEFYYHLQDVKMFSPFDSKAVDEMISETMAQTNKRNGILNLLSSITNYRFHLQSNTEVIWALPVSEIKDDVESEPVIEVYAYPNIGTDLKIEKFTEIKQEGILFLPPKDYFTYDPIDDRTKQIKLPMNIGTILDKYYNLSNKERLIVDAASYQICNALDLYKKMRSLSFLSAVSSIETMIKIEFEGEELEFECTDCKTLKSSARTCKKCGRPKWGIAEKFREYLFKYVGESAKNKKLYNQIYSIRSNIVHTEYLMFKENILDWDFNEKSNDLYLKHLTAIQLARISLVNWLLHK